MFILHGNTNVINTLGDYYKEMKKYYVMAINNGCDEVITQFGMYYKNKQKWEKMIKCYLSANEDSDCYKPIIKYFKYNLNVHNINYALLFANNINDKTYNLKLIKKMYIYQNVKIDKYY